MIRPRAQAGWLEDGQLTRTVYIVASPYKTATTTVGQALLRLGAGTADMGHRKGLLLDHAQTVRMLNAEITRDTDYADYMANRAPDVRRMLADFTAKLAPYDIFSDAPFGHTRLHPFIRKALAPRARFIWVNRAKDDWVASVRHWEETHPDVYPRHTRWQDDPEGAEADLLARRTRWRRQFRRLQKACPADCLVIHTRDLKTYGALADFCGVPVPDDPVPRANVSRS